MKKWFKKHDWVFAFLIAVILTLLLSTYANIIWDKSDWIFLLLLIGIVMLNSKLNKIIELISKK